MSPADRLQAVPIGSLWRRRAYTYRIEEHDGAVIVYRNVRTGSRNWDTVHAFVGPKADFRRATPGAPHLHLVDGGGEAPEL